MFLAILIVLTTLCFFCMSVAGDSLSKPTLKKKVCIAVDSIMSGIGYGVVSVFAAKHLTAYLEGFL